MSYSVLKYGSPMLSGIPDLEDAKREAVRFVASGETPDIEIRDSDNETVTVGYFDGLRFHWTKDKGQAEAWKSLSFVTRPPLWRGRSGKEGG